MRGFCVIDPEARHPSQPSYCASWWGTVIEVMNYVTMIRDELSENNRVTVNPIDGYHFAYLGVVSEKHIYLYIKYKVKDRYSIFRYRFLISQRCFSAPRDSLKVDDEYLDNVLGVQALLWVVGAIRRTVSIPKKKWGASWSYTRSFSTIWSFEHAEHTILVLVRGRSRDPRLRISPLWMSRVDLSIAEWSQALWVSARWTGDWWDMNGIYSQDPINLKMFPRFIFWDLSSRPIQGWLARICEASVPAQVVEAQSQHRSVKIGLSMQWRQGLLGKEGSYRVADIGQPFLFDRISWHLPASPVRMFDIWRGGPGNSISQTPR